MWAYAHDTDFALGNYFFRAVKFTKNPNLVKYNSLIYGIESDKPGSFSLSNGSGFDRNLIIFSADTSLSM